MPFKFGMPISITATSGFSVPAMATASRPSLASPTTARSGSAATTMRRPARIRVWSSASRTRIVVTRPPVGEGGTPPSRLHLFPAGIPPGTYRLTG